MGVAKLTAGVVGIALVLMISMGMVEMANSYKHITPITVKLDMLSCFLYSLKNDLRDKVVIVT